MAGSTRLAVLVTALACAGCATGHLLDRARRWERPIAYENAAVEGGRLSVAYTAAVTNQFGRQIGTCERRAAVRLEQLTSTDATVERVRVEQLADDAPLAGTPTALRIPGAGDPERLFVADDAGGALLQPAVLTRKRLAPWVYPLLPLAAAYDVVAVPVLMVFAPLVIIPGD